MFVFCTVCCCWVLSFTILIPLSAAVMRTHTKRWLRAIGMFGALWSTVHAIGTYICPTDPVAVIRLPAESPILISNPFLVSRVSFASVRSSVIHCARPAPIRFANSADNTLLIDRRAKTFKYLVSLVANQNSIQEEIKKKLNLWLTAPRGAKPVN